MGYFLYALESLLKIFVPQLTLKGPHLAKEIGAEFAGNKNY